MKIKKKLLLLKKYYEFNRQVGHTTAALDGVRNTERAIILAADHLNRKYLRDTKDLKDSQVIILNNDLRALNKPIVLDNATVYSICCEALEEIEKLEGGA